MSFALRQENLVTSRESDKRPTLAALLSFTPDKLLLFASCLSLSPELAGRTKKMHKRSPRRNVARPIFHSTANALLEAQ